MESRGPTSQTIFWFLYFGLPLIYAHSGGVTEKYSMCGIRLCYTSCRTCLCLSWETPEPVSQSKLPTGGRTTYRLNGSKLSTGGHEEDTMLPGNHYPAAWKFWWKKSSSSQTTSSSWPWKFSFCTLSGFAPRGEPLSKESRCGIMPSNQLETDTDHCCGVAPPSDKLHGLTVLSKIQHLLQVPSDSHYLIFIQH